MYHEESLEIMSKLLDKSINEILETYKNNILFLPKKENPKIGHVIKEYECSDLKVMDFIRVKDADYINVGENIIGIPTSILDVYRIHIPSPKKKETKSELNSKNILTAMKITCEIMEADAELAMNQLMAINEKVKVAAKLKELGYETKKQRKEVHDAIKYYKSRIKELGFNGAADDTAEKYLFQPDFIKKIVGFQNKQRQNRFK